MIVRDEVFTTRREAEAFEVGFNFHHCEDGTYAHGPRELYGPWRTAHREQPRFVVYAHFEPDADLDLGPEACPLCGEGCDEVPAAQDRDWYVDRAEEYDRAAHDDLCVVDWLTFG